ncbi:MAG: DNA polymerase IV [Bacillota bacterium]
MRDSRRDDILLCDLDAFFASVEQRDHPAYRGKPVIVGGSPRQRGVVSTCSYEARRYGVRSAMPMSRAVKLCPNAVILPGRMEVYRAVSGQVAVIFERFTPDIEPVSIDEAYLAVKRGSGLETAFRIREAVRGELDLPITVGISVNKLLAKIACEQAKPEGVKALWPEDVEARLWPLPLQALPGLGPVAVQKLNRVGIKTVGELAAAPLEVLSNLLGRSARTFLNYAAGEDGRVLEPPHQVKSISEECTFPLDIVNRDRIAAVLLEQAEGVGYRLRSQGLWARTVCLKLRFADFTTISREITLAEPTDRSSVIYRAALTLLERNYTGRPCRLAGVRVSGLEQCRQLSLLPPRPFEEKEQNLDRVQDRLRGKYGKEMVFKAGRLMGKDENQEGENH